MEEKKTWDLISLASIPLIMTLGNSMLIPVLPLMQKQLKITSFQVSLLITVYSIVAIILIPIAGFLSDEYGRKKIIIPSLIISAAGGLISGVSSILFDNPYYFILLGRLIQGIGAAGAAPIVLPLIGDMFKTEEEVSNGLGIIETSNTFGKVLSPILGAFLATILWYLPFLAIPVFSLISILLVAFLVKTPKKKEKPVKLKEFIAETKKIFKNKGRCLFGIFSIGIIIMFVLFGVLFYLSNTLEDQYQIHGIKKGLILAIPLASLSISSFITGKKIGKNQTVMKWITFFGMIISFGTMLTLVFVDALAVSLAILFISGIGIGASLPALDALITEGIEKKERGTITAIYSSMRFIGVALGPPTAAILMKYDDRFIFYLMSGISLVASILVFITLHPNRKIKRRSID